MTGAWTLSLGLPNSLRPDAAQLYWHAFGPKLGRVLGPERHALAFLENVIRADHVLIGREAGLTRDFAVLKADLEKALAKAHLPPKDTEKPWQGSRR